MAAATALAEGWEWLLAPTAWELADGTVWLKAALRGKSGGMVQFFEQSTALPVSECHDEASRRALYEGRVAAKQGLKEQLRAWAVGLGALVAV